MYCRLTSPLHSNLIAYSIITRILPTEYFEILHVYTDTFNNFFEVFGNCNVVPFFFGAKAHCVCKTVIIIISSIVPVYVLIINGFTVS